MKVIEQVKKDLSGSLKFHPGEALTLCLPERLAALVEYYEAAEAWLDAPRFNCQKEKSRFEAARANLIREE